MITIFDPNYPYEMVMFSTTHWVTIILIFFIILSLYVFRRPIRSNPSLKKGVKAAILGSLVVPEVMLHIWYISNGIWDSSYSLPLELCSFSLFAGILLLLRPHQLLYEFVFFAGVSGAFLAIVTPNLDYPFPHFRFSHFFIVHMGIILAAMYMSWIEQLRPTWKSIPRTMILINLFVVLVIGMNLLLDANYMFLMRKPSTVSLIDVLGPHPYYLISEEFVALLFFTLIYFFFYQVPKYFKKREQGQGNQVKKSGNFK
ncbi:YwaF family protein [Paenibacillus eucommiae]|uniref:Integral membrane protein (TIGR02206 family) n=1 Tax=Paenibacillus eucommiae TaxID=1355755 RepID=A0ABS4IXK7_9BACL|nr:TIGR02206 family membrane protein [Paenibacillus eucommiae]MBP1992319.1 putative integral membrane protein (TIGR02206 family) [Paenibacillus eucommiae]